MAEANYTDEELEKDALSIAVMDDGQKIIVLPNDHPAMVAREARFEAEAQARRDARRIDANHFIAGDFPVGAKHVFLNGEPITHVTECYVGERGWLVRQLRDENGNIHLIGDDMATERLDGHVELRDG